MTLRQQIYVNNSLCLSQFSVNGDKSEPQNGLGWRDLQVHLVPNPCHGQGFPPPH